MAKPKLTRPAKERRFPGWLAVIAVLLVICIAAALLWQPVVIRFFPEFALTLAVANTATQAALRLGSPLTDCIGQCAGYVQNGSMDAEISLSGLLTNFSYQLTSQTDPANRRQTSSYHVNLLGLTTDISTYLDGDCVVFSSNLLGEENYGITFATYGSDLTAAGFDKTLSADTLAKLNDYVNELNAVYPSSNSRSAGFELPSIEAPDWVRTVLAYLGELEFTSSDTVMILDGQETNCSAITTQMDSRYAANMFLDALKTVSSNVFLASSLYSDDEAEATPELQEKLEYYRDQTEGNVTVSAIIHKGALVAVDLEWVFAENKGLLPINDKEQMTLNLGADPSTSAWNLTLQETKGQSNISTTYSLSFTDDFYHLTELKSENNSTVQTDLKLRWDEASGLITLDMNKLSGTNALSASTSGTILRDNNRVSINIAGLYDFFKIANLPDFLQGIDLGLVSDASVVAVFSADTAITKPEYINLDKWTIPWILDLFL